MRLTLEHPQNPSPRLWETRGVARTPDGTPSADGGLPRLHPLLGPEASRARAGQAEDLEETVAPRPARPHPVASSGTPCAQTSRPLAGDGAGEARSLPPLWGGRKQSRSVSL